MNIHRDVTSEINPSYHIAVKLFSGVKERNISEAHLSLPSLC